MSKHHNLKSKPHTQADLVSRSSLLPLSGIIQDLPVSVDNTIDLALSKGTRSKSKLTKTDYSTSQAKEYLDQKPSIEKLNKPKSEANSFTHNSLANNLTRPLSLAEEKLFQELWRLTIGSNQKIWQGKIIDLMIRTGYSARASLTRAIAGLSALGLILVQGQDTSPKGRIYQITEQALSLINKTPEIKSDFVENKSPKKEKPPLSKLPKKESKNNVLESDNSDRINQIRLIYQDLTNNSWTSRDDIIGKGLIKMPLPFIILGICYTLTKSARHQIESLKACLPFIEEHYKLMRVFSNQDLLEIAYKQLMLVKQAQRSNKWPK